MNPLDNGGTPHVHHSAAGALDALLGRPGEEHGAFRPADLAGLDEREEFPAAACGVLDAFGLNDHYVPAAFGGELRDYTDLMQLLRTVARRDLTVAVAHGKTFLGAAPVWVAGGADQAAALGALIADGAVVSWGLTERAHGSDLLAGELTATPENGGWRLNGEKWLINNATRGGLICVLARTDPAGGPRGSACSWSTSAAWRLTRTATRPRSPPTASGARTSAASPSMTR